MISIDEIKDKTNDIISEISRAIIGYREEIKLILAALLANGHVLLEGVPGIAKTTIARALTRVLGLNERETYVKSNIPFKGFSRIQFTPDLMPSDITGSLIFNPVTRSFEPRLGPVFSYIVLADEINRATPRTQSAMLQAMQEREVTIGDKTYQLEIRSEGKFFFVIATQNPIEQEGTYPLPEAQLDRFTMRIIINYPRSLEDELNIYKLHAYRLAEPVNELEQIVTPDWVIEAQNTISEKIVVPDIILDYVARIIRSTRPEVLESVRKYFELGASPRAGIMLVRVAKVLAAMRGSERVEAVDVEKAVFHVLNHRVIPNIDLIIEYGGDFAARIRVIDEGLKYVIKSIT
ncbi:MAG: AAA family ATPase [Desulfurococcaceae archaeon]